VLPYLDPAGYDNAYRLGAFPMSKGLGHVGRAIAALFDAEPDNAFTTAELCQRVWPDCGDWPERTQRVAVLRAAKSLARHRPDLGLQACGKEERGNENVFYRRDRVMAYAMGHLKKWLAPYATDEERRAMLAPGGREHHMIEPGGAWLRHTEMAIARRDGDHEKLDRLEEEQDRAMGGVAESIRAGQTKMGRDP
jgi:hypothetical protein